MSISPVTRLRKPIRRQKTDVPAYDEVDGRTLFDAVARRTLGMSADEFEAAWERGDFVGREEDSDVIHVWMLRAPKDQ